MLYWLMNMGFAGGGAAVIGTDRFMDLEVHAESAIDLDGVQTSEIDLEASSEDDIDLESVI